MMNAELFPGEVISHVPRITLTGHEQLHIEQHRGLIDYSPENIAFRSSCGIVRISGAGMGFSLYTSGEARINGQIDSVCFDPAEGSR